MKTQFNLTTSSGDLDRFSSREHFLSVVKDFDGVELMYAGEDERGIVPEDKVTGLHMSFAPYWLDFWLGDTERLVDEFGSLENAWSYYGGSDRSLLLEQIRRDFGYAKRYGAEYMVFHACDCSSKECVLGEYYHSDEEVVDALCEMLNAALPEDKDGPWLLLENLWEAGLTFTRPEITKRLIEGVKYPKVGFMLDTGHLMHTRLDLKTQKEALRYINNCLNEHGELCRYIRGIHLNQSLTGAYIRKVRKDPPKFEGSYSERMGVLFTYIFNVDLHRPFVCPGVKELIERISPDYLTYEFISRDLKELTHLLRRQRNALQK